MDLYMWIKQRIWENFVGVGSCNYHFLARPRRFGKSLLCSTIAELFQGDANLFEELYIYDKWDFKAEQCPVIHIKMDLFASDNANLFAIQETEFLREIARQNDLSLSSSVDCGVHSLLSDLVRKLHRKHGKGVVVIIDEYDTPLHSFLNRPEELEVMRTELSKLYGVLKPLEDYLRLVYLTGILNFSIASLFSGLNNIEDHTFSRNLNSICGYTREELEANFEDHLNHFATEKMMSYDELMTKLTTNFNGYRFSVGVPIDNLPPTVFNPFAINRAIESETFQDQWIESGHCEQLVSLILKSRASGKALEDMSIFLEDIDSISTPSELSYQCLMHYAGYTTIHGYNHKTGMVTLAPPNYNIGQSVIKVIAQTIFKDGVANKDLELARELVNEILFSAEHDVGKQMKTVERILNCVVLLFFPWQLLKANEKDLESTYNVMLNSFMQLGCLDHTYIGSEMSVSTGDIMECVIESKDKEVVAIFEYNLFKSALVAMNQMKRKSFADRFPDQAVIFVAINITKARTVEVLIERIVGH